MIYGAPGSGGLLGIDNFGFNASSDLAATGACCLPSDWCSNLSQAACEQLGG